VTEITLAVRLHHPDVTWVYFHRVVEWSAVPRVGELLAVDYQDYPVELREISWDLDGRVRIDLPAIEPESGSDANAALARLDAAGWHRGSV
jgi:hypothetical protein